MFSMALLFIKMLSHESPMGNTTHIPEYLKLKVNLISLGCEKHYSL